MIQITVTDVTWQTNETADSSLAWDTAIPPSAGTMTDPATVLSHSLRVNSLAPCSTYYVAPSSTDVAGHATTDDNGGQYHALATNMRLVSTPSSVDTPGSIPDDDPSGFQSVIAIGLPGEVHDVDVALDISHPWDADLDVWLVGPDGTRVELTTDNGGSGSHYHGTVFDDQAAVSIFDASAPFSGAYRPEQPLSDLNGIAATGAWMLDVRDDLDGAMGVLDGWELHLELYASCDAFDIFADGFETGDESAWSAGEP
jgi:subtilisin-like proprotein convertase family protein